jgi:hypothetical protein
MLRALDDYRFFKDEVIQTGGTRKGIPHPLCLTFSNLVCQSNPSIFRPFGVEGELYA